MLLKFVPKDEFLSARTAPVRYNRSRIPTNSSTYPPSVTNGDVVSPTEGTTTPPSALVPATTLRPAACTCSKVFLKYCRPTVVLEVTADERRNDAFVEKVAV